MRRPCVALVLALVLLVPPTPAPARAGTFEFEITGPMILLMEILVIDEKDKSHEEITAICIGAAGLSGPWIVFRSFDDQVEWGYVGTAAALKDKPNKFKAKFSDKAKDAASGEIQFVDVDASADPDTGTAEGVEAGMKGKARYVVDPVSLRGLNGVGSGKVKINDKTNKGKLTIHAPFAFKLTEATCTLTFDDTDKAAGLRVRGAGVRALDVRIGP